MVAGHLVLIPTGSGAVQMMAYVHQDFRRQGIATALTTAAIEEAGLDGFHYIWLLIAKKNLAARRCLQNLGFRIQWEDEREVQFLRSTVGN
jgi:ribosomal protein S18 acetylase RimI-like enzyme